MFIDNKYTATYYRLVDRARGKTKSINDGNQTHHILPRCLGGTNSPDNLVVLTYKEHRVAHRLLTKMVSGSNRYKMLYAYRWFNSKYPVLCSHHIGTYTEESARKMVKTRNARGSYRRGKDNTFARPEVIEMVRQRMVDNNPMKDQAQRARMRSDNPRSRPIVTPGGTFVSRAAALRHHGFKHWKVLYDLMVKHPDQWYWLEDSTLRV